MLEYDDEWVVPGEVEYAERKTAEIEARIGEYHKGFTGDKWGNYHDSIYIQITEHIVGKFEVTLSYSEWGTTDIDVTNGMLHRWYRDTIAVIDAPKIFDLPADDIRSSLPEWNESLLPDSACGDILRMHSSMNKVMRGIREMDGDYHDIAREYGLGDVKCSRVMETFIDKLNKLNTENKPVDFTELEKEIGRYMASNDKHNIYDYWKYYYYDKPWFFPLTMSERDTIDAVHEAYLNASKRSRRLIPDRFDKINLGRGWEAASELIGIENHECLYQGKAGNLLIRFLFDFKDKKIVMAYPVVTEKKRSNGG